MFRSFRFSRRGLTAISLVCFAGFLAFCFFMLRSSPPDTVDIGGEAYPLSVESDEDIERFLTACGYSPDSLVSRMQVTVPVEWNAVYTEYGELQAEQGLGLERYKGRPAEQIVYSLKDTDLFAVLLISDGRITAAHACTMVYGDGVSPLIVKQ